VEQINYVSSGEVFFGAQNGWLVSTPLGSCVAVVAYDSKKLIGGIAHIMLPGLRHKQNDDLKFRYAIDSMNYLLSSLKEKGVNLESLSLCLVGGANVLHDKNSTIAKDLIDSIMSIVSERELKIAASSLGGYDRRTASIDLSKGIVYYTLGDKPRMILYKYLS